MAGARLRNRWLVSVVMLVLALSVALVGCVSVADGSQPASPAASVALTPSPLGIPKVTPEGPGVDVVLLADVEFHASFDFSSALQLVMNLGLQPVYNCSGYTDSDVRWQSQDERPGFSFIAQAPQPLEMIPTENPTPQPAATSTTQWLPRLEVIPTPLVPGDWLRRLAALPSVVAIYDGYGGCPMIPVDVPPVPGVLYFLGQTVWVEDVRVTFAASGASGYAQALATVSGLGFRLADPCYEQSLPPPAWRPMGQQASFASGGALVVAITAANSTRWLAQLNAAPGVASVQAPYTQRCAAS
ncbi:MAG: hypothetical protein ACHQ1E_02165 [Ktedonobacterales bacterium]